MSQKINIEPMYLSRFANKNNIDLSTAKFIYYSLNSSLCFLPISSNLKDKIILQSLLSVENTNSFSNYSSFDFLNILKSSNVATKSFNKAINQLSKELLYANFN